MKKPDRVVRKAMEMFERGIRTVDIAAELQCDTTTVLAWARKAGITRTHKRYRIAHMYRPEIVDRYVREGRSCTWLEEVYGVDRSTIVRWVRQAGHEIRGRKSIDGASVRKLYEKFKSQRVVAEILGVVPSTVHYALHRGSEA